MIKKSIAVLGAGSWGTALAIHLSRIGHEVCLWAHQVAHENKLITDRENLQYLPSVPFPDNLSITSNINKALAVSEAVLVVVPSHVFREVLETISVELLGRNLHLAWATKGFEPKTSAMLHQVAFQVLGEAMPMAVLSGPTFASEVARGLPAAMVSASSNQNEASYWADLLQSSKFRVYTGSDVIGVEIGGAYKNIMAIAIGLSDGLKLGANARAALMSRGLAEMNYFALAMGGKSETIMGLSGVGDLILTCTDNLSRNRRFGLLLADSNMSVASAMQKIGQVVEGVKAVKVVKKITENSNLELPIMEQVYAIVNGDITPQQAVADLMARDTGSESF